MVSDIPPSLLQLNPAAAVSYWIFVLVYAVVLSVILAFLYSAARHQSLVKGIGHTVVGIGEGLRDILLLPLGFRRVWAIAVLSFREAIRRRILYVFVLFLAPFLFAGWYLPNAEEGQIKFLVAFVTNAMTWVLLPLVVFLVSMSLPNDLKSKTLHTVVTKPVRRLEIVLGRIVGFMGIFTLVLLAMGIISLVYLWGNVSDEVKKSNWTARVPVYARPPSPTAPPLIFRKSGQFQEVGTDVGKEYRYRSHIEGATTDAAHWFFLFDPQVFAGKSGLRMEMTFDVFKTTKGDPTRRGAETAGVWCSVRINELENPDPQKALYSTQFRVNNNRTNVLEDIPPDVFKSGRLEVVVNCLTRNQFVGMAAADLYFLATERSFAVNFIKGLASIWFKVLLLTCVSVSASTVLNGFVTILFTTMIYILGFFYEFLVGVVTRQVQGGGPIESFFRLVTQSNQQSPLPPGPFATVAQWIDHYVLQGMSVLAHVVPNLQTVDTVDFVASGFDIPEGMLINNLVLILGYVVPVMIAGYFFLKSREIATA